MSPRSLTYGTTRSQLIVSARKLFAAHGFAGASIAAIARELGLTKQALLHHFGSKEALYALAVEQTADEVLHLLFDAMEDDRPPEDQLEAFFARYLAQMQFDADPARLLGRELIDAVTTGGEAARPQDGGAFVTLLESLVATVQATERWQGAGVQGALAVTTQLLGAAALIYTGSATLTGVFGPAATQGARDQSVQIYAALVSGALRH